MKLKLTDVCVLCDWHDRFSGMVFTKETFKEAYSDVSNWDDDHFTIIFQNYLNWDAMDKLDLFFLTEEKKKDKINDFLDDVWSDIMLGDYDEFLYFNSLEIEEKVFSRVIPHIEDACVIRDDNNNGVVLSKSEFKDKYSNIDIWNKESFGDSLFADFQTYLESNFYHTEVFLLSEEEKKKEIDAFLQDNWENMRVYDDSDIYYFEDLGILS